MSRVCIFIPHHRNPKILKPLFESLFQMGIDESTMHVVLVDNASNDGSVEFTQHKYPRVHILHFETNQGFAPALNEAVHTIDSEWVCFLNNDMRVDPDWLPNLIYAADSIDSPCFSSHIFNWEGDKTQFAGGWINVFGKGFESDQLQDTSPYPIFFPCGGAMLIRRDIFLEIGGFDKDYFMIYEDVDLGWRLWLLGYKVYLVPDAYVMHKGHASLQSESYERKAVYYERNSLATLYKNLGNEYLHYILPYAIQETVIRAKAIGGIGIPVRYSSAGLATLKGLKAFFDCLPAWKQKRRQIQPLRILSDQEIFARFFPHPTQLWGYCEEQYRNIHNPTIYQNISSLLEKAAQIL